MIDRAMVLAAGLGTRMRPLTDHCPKPLLPVAGRTLLDHALDRVLEGGIRQAVVNVHYRADMVIDALGARKAPPDIAISDETGLLLETGGGVRRALALLGKRPFAVINSDAIWIGPSPLAVLLDHWDASRMDALLLLVPCEKALNYTRAGDFSLEEGRLVRRGAAPRAPFVYTGVQIIEPALFASTPEGPFSLNLVWDRALAAGRAHGVVYGARWVDVGTPQGLESASAALSGMP